VVELVIEAKQHIECLTPEAVAEELARGVLLVDVREPGERDTHGFIEGGKSVPRGLLEFHADPASPAHDADFDRKRRIILHCASGGRSALAGYALRLLGFEDVAHLEGGLAAWVAAGLAVGKPGE
jgi:rhodanese-related sulfurtransferase